VGAHDPYLLRRVAIELGDFDVLQLDGQREEELSELLELVAVHERRSMEAIESVRSLANALDATAVSLQGVVDSTGAVGEAVGAVAACVRANMDAFAASVAGAEALLSDIAKVARSTSILALNAAIEAGRSGDAGRGFSVVAQEVRATAAKLESLAESIAARIEAMAGAAEATLEAAGRLVEAVERLGADHRTLESLGAELQTQTALLQLRTSAQTHLNHLATACREALNGPSAIEPEELPLAVEAEACRLGRWLAGAQAAALRGRPGFDALCVHHRLLHEQAREVLLVARRGQREDVERLVRRARATRSAFLGAIAALDASIDEDQGQRWSSQPVLAPVSARRVEASRGAGTTSRVDARRS
jgi:hypothetical protein